MKRVVRYLKGTAHYKLKLSDITSNNPILVGWADANWAEDHVNRKSNSGYVFKVHGGVVSWSCRKQTCVALSTTEAEFISLSEACQEAVWMRRLLEDLNQEITGPVTIFEDNQSVLKLIEEEKLSKRTKHIDTKVCFVKDHVEKGTVNCQYCPTDQMIADMLTKPLAKPKLEELRKLCGICANEQEC